MSLVLRNRIGRAVIVRTIRRSFGVFSGCCDMEGRRGGSFENNPYDFDHSGWKGERRYQRGRGSHGSGGRRGRGRGQHRGRPTNHSVGSEYDSTPRRGRGRHPAGLSGREIGLWYAKRGKEKKKQAEMSSRKVVHMDENQVDQVSRILMSSQLQKERGNDLDEKPGSSQNVMDDETDEPFAEGDFISLEPGADSWFDSPLSSSENDTWNEKLKREISEKSGDSRFLQMQEFRKTLPAYQKRTELVELINNEQVIVISGETGCGKTTQVPQFILDDAIQKGEGMACKVVCTQPRRISAISVAERVAEERNEECGLGVNSCGYQIRLDSKLPRRNGSILYCTTGILLQWLKSDSNLTTVSHIVLDEVHERDLMTDFLLTIIKEIIERRKDLKIILMSATLNSDLFSEYFNSCPCFHIPGFTYPVQSVYLEEVMDITCYTPPDAAYQVASEIESLYNGDLRRGRAGKLLSKNVRPEMVEEWGEYEKELSGKVAKSDLTKLWAMHAFSQNNVDPGLIVSVIRYIVHEQPKGAILVFVPGWTDIKAVNDELLRDRGFNSSRFLIIPLHSLMPTTNQRQVFDRPPPGVTKIVIATNIAETSITIDDVVHVIDSGKIKITEFDHVTNMGSLQMKWISRSNAKQRRGRAGRVQEGFCYHLYTKLQEREFDDYLLPEMLRTPLDQLCLQIRVLKLGKIEDFLSRSMESPNIDSINLSIQKLVGLSALHANQDLTPLGYHLSKLPVEPQIGKMILMGAIFSCLDPILTIAANLSFKDPFVVPLGKEKLADRQKRELADGANSDHIMLLKAFQRWEAARNRGHREENDFCWTNFLARSTLNMLREMKGQFANHLHKIGFSPSSNPRDPAMNRLSKSDKVIVALVCSGLYPNICKITSFNSWKPVKLQTKTEKKIDFHPKSVNYGAMGNKFTEKWLCYYLKMKTTGVYLFDTSEVTAYPLLFFGGNITAYYDTEMKDDVIAVDDWIVFRSKPHIAKLVRDLRRALDDILEQKIRDPSVSALGTSDASSKVLASIVELITTE